MASTPASIEDHTEALLAQLRAVLPEIIKVGDHRAAGTAPHCVVYLIPGGGTDGSLCDMHADVTFIWQVTAVGRLAAEARWVGDHVRAALLGIELAVEGRALWPLRLHTSSPGIERDDDPPGTEQTLFYCTDRFTTASTPTAA